MENYVGKSSTKIKDKTLGDINVKGVGGEEEAFKNNKKKWSVIQRGECFKSKRSGQKS